MSTEKMADDSTDGFEMSSWIWKEFWQLVEIWKKSISVYKVLITKQINQS